MNCIVIGLGTAEGIGDFLRRAELVDRCHGEDGATFEVEGAGVGVFVEQGGDDFAREIAVFAEVIALLRAASVDFSSHIDSTISETDLFANLSVEIPASSNEAGRDELRADVAFTKGFFVHANQEYFADR